ncbi:hypothetical protein HDE68_004176 [Pedobacter cryoconitis]|uniref:Mobilization protein n=1 Tax=Pedobacter cryoconitis TaxID=188932 RepID=A0A7W8ZQD7_9SPHI|nr:mobilization protein [Pedobacter cryoconitis]MBB5638247.1 hypothetical protein [Pedobacter cryoconitis]
MARRKAKDQDKILSHPIIIRLTEQQYKKVADLWLNSDCRSIGEVVRKIIANRPIKLLHKDISMNAPMEEMALIRKEIKRIGVNINQQTHSFHISQNPIERSFHSSKTAETYKAIEPKIERLMELISKLAEKWLQK